jgi:hypothetical protein
MLLSALLLFAQSASPSPPGLAGQPMSVSWPAHIDISTASASNFARYNQSSGTILVMVKCDGTKAAMVPTTADIDGDLKSALMNFVSQTKVVAGTGCQDETFIVHFDVPSGNMTETQLPRPPG